MADEASTNTVELGDDTYELQPQPYPRLFRQLSEFGDELQTLGDLDTGNAGALVAALGSRVHSFLRIFIPNLMSEHRFAGYATREALEAGEVDEQAEAAAPTLPQLIDAVEVAFEVNGGKRLGGLLGKLLGPGMAQAVQKLVAARISETLSQGSTSSPSLQDGEPEPTLTPLAPTRDGGGSPEATSSLAEEAGGSSIGAPASAGSPSLVT